MDPYFEIDNDDEIDPLEIEIEEYDLPDECLQKWEESHEKGLPKADHVALPACLVFIILMCVIFLIVFAASYR